ncbi:contractile injection system tape measure protein [Lunatimonas salinarum]|uniref:contractile injection system tape measure protein n=1 Tax=Lunatimonas salinarum TaxID=1774590 RepID=UPI001AE0E06F|nr:contractile injection system tape measure protein [Lunatimonas salinarum]
MPTNNEEIFIQKVTVEVITASTDNAKAVERNIHDFLEKRILPEIEKWLSERFPLSSENHLLLSDLSLTVDIDLHQIDSIDLQPALIRQISNQLIRQLEVQDQASHGVVEEADLPPFTIDEWKRWSNPEVFTYFKKELLKSHESSKYTFLSEEQKGFYAWLYFLQHGIKPWFAASLIPRQMSYTDQGSNWVELQEFSALASAVLRMPQAKIRLYLQYGVKEIVHLMNHLVNRPISLDRFNELNQQFNQNIQQFNHILFLTYWLESQSSNDFSGGQVDSLERIWPLISPSALPKKKWTRFWQQVARIYGFESHIEAILSKTRLNHFFDDSELLEGMPIKTSLDTSLPSEVALGEQEFITEQLDYSLPVIHAGLILLHPFLLAFFQDVDVIGKDKKMTHSVLGLHLLHYVATGNLKPFEFELGFEKFLVGWNGLFPYKKGLVLTNDQLRKCDLLLESLMANWQKLKNTGKETVRTGFLQREGKIIEEPDRYRLVLERKAQDVLLKGLPFNLGVVKLPWQKKLVFVEW